MGWLKTFSAVLAAGLVILAILWINQATNRRAAEWEAQAKMLGDSLDQSIRNVESAAARNDDEWAQKFRTTTESILSSADDRLRDVPSRAEGRVRLEAAVRRAKDFLAGNPQRDLAKEWNEAAAQQIATIDKTIGELKGADRNQAVWYAAHEALVQLMDKYDAQHSGMPSGADPRPLEAAIERAKAALTKN